MEQRNLILAFVLSLAILLGWSALFPPEAPVEVNTKVEKQANLPDSASSVETPDNDAMPESRPTEEAKLETEPPIQEQGKVVADGVTLSNELLTLRIDTKSWFVGANLLKYRASKEKDSGPVSVLQTGDGHALYLNSGILDHPKISSFRLVRKETIEGADRAVFEATLEDGRLWRRTVTLSSGSYAINLEDTVRNGAGLKMFRQVVERNPDREKSTFYEFAGPIGFYNDKLDENGYDDLDEGGSVRKAATGGWAGVTSRYFIVTLIGNPEQDYSYYYKGNGRTYQAGVIDSGKAKGKDAVFTSRIYIGPKSLSVIKELGVGLERSVDFGWTSFIAKPLHEALLWFYKYIPNYGWCIILLLLCIKIIFFYPTQKSYESMAAMRKLQPEQQRLKELYGDDRQRMGQEMMELYKKNKVNPLGGCLPILIQIPVFFALYKVLLMSIEMRHAPFMGWIQDLSAQDPFYVLPVLMGISMFIQQRLNPQPADPVQAKVMQFLPILFTVMFLFFPSGLVLYWVVNNVLSIIQQRLVMKRMKVD